MAKKQLKENQTVNEKENINPSTFQSKSFTIDKETKINIWENNSEKMTSIKAQMQMMEGKVEKLMSHASTQNEKLTDMTKLMKLNQTVDNSQRMFDSKAD